MKRRRDKTLELLQIIRIIFGSIFVLFLPGLTWSYAFFQKNEIDIIERIALSFGLSISIVPLTVFYFNYLLKIPINLVTVTTIITILILIPLIYIKRREKINNTYRNIINDIKVQLGQ